MTDVRIRRCTLRVVRRGGWSWGPDPAALLAGAVGALPRLLAGRLGQLLPAAAEATVARPLRLAVRLRREELAALCRWRGGEGGAPPDALVHRLDAALAAALGPDLAVEEEVRPAEPESSEPQPGLATTSSETPAALLVAWWRPGVLAALLAALPPALPARWRRRLLAAGEGGGAATADSPADRTGAGDGAGVEGEVPPAAAVRRSLLRAAEVLARAVEEGGPAALPAALRRWAQAERAGAGRCRPSGSPQPVPPPGRSGEEGAPPEVAPPRPAVPAPAAAAPGPRLDGEVEVASALPWLVLGPLARTGWLEALAAAIEIAGLTAAAPACAAAIAWKVLSPPERGWRRRPGELAVAAAFAGLAEPPPGPQIARFAAAFAGFCPLLDAELARSTLAGRQGGGPLLAAPAPVPGGSGGGGDELLLLDPGGLFPFAWLEEAAGIAGLAPLLGDDPPLLLVHAGAARPSLLAGLEAAGRVFVTPAPPARGEPWRPVPGAGPVRLWSNRPAAVAWTAPLRRELARLAESASLAAELGSELAARPALPWPATGPLSGAPGAGAAGSGTLGPGALERSLTLAAGSALGSLGWELWRGRERPHPLLALERFADLSARVRFSRHRIEVRLPLGRRHRDLHDHGLLAPVRGVPWLDGRTVELGGG